MPVNIDENGVWASGFCSFNIIRPRSQFALLNKVILGTCHLCRCGVSAGLLANNAGGPATSASVVLGINDMEMLGRCEGQRVLE